MPPSHPSAPTAPAPRALTGERVSRIVILVSSTYRDTIADRSLLVARLLGPSTGFLWFVVAGWVLLMAAGAAGVGISTDQTPLGPWLIVSLGMGTFVLVGGRWWPVLLASAVGATAFAFVAQGAYRGSTSDFVGGLDVMVGLSLVIAVWSATVAAVLLWGTSEGPSRRRRVPSSGWGTEIRWFAVNYVLAVAIWLVCVAAVTLVDVSANGSLEGWPGSPPAQALGWALLSLPSIVILGTPMLVIALAFWRAWISLVGSPRLLAYLIAATFVTVGVAFGVVPERSQQIAILALPAFAYAALVRIPTGWSRSQVEPQIAP